MSGPQRKPGIFGVGMFWSNWRAEHLPEEYRSNPRAYDQAQMDLAVELGADCIPVGFGWIDLEPEPGARNWSAFDEHVEDAEERGLELVAYIGHTPDWAVPEPEPGMEPLPGYRTPPQERFRDAFSSYCREVAARYREHVRYYSFWNEPNGCSWVRAGCANMGGYPLYTQWLKRAYTSLHEGNADAVVSAGSLDYNAGVPAGWRYVEGIYEEGGGPYFDAIDIHPYAPRGVHWQAILDTRDVMVAHGDADKPIWISEYGWEHPDGQQAADDLNEFLSLIRRPEFSFVTHARYLVVSDLNEGLYGLTNVALERKPIFHEFARHEKSLRTPATGEDLPAYARPYELGGNPGTRPSRTPGKELEIRGSKDTIEFDEELALQAELNTSGERKRDVRWYVNGVQEPGVHGTQLFFSRRPDEQTSYTVRIEVELASGKLSEETVVTVRPFVSNRFTVLIEPHALSVNRGSPATFETRVLNKASHDLTFDWTISGKPEGQNGDTLVVQTAERPSGAYTVAVSCRNADNFAQATASLNVVG